MERESPLFEPAYSNGEVPVVLPLLLRTADEAGVSEIVEADLYEEEPGSGVPEPPADPAKLDGEARNRLAGETPVSMMPFGSTDCFDDACAERKSKSDDRLGVGYAPFLASLASDSWA